MILNSPYISGSLTVTGNEVVSGSLTVLGGITMSGSIASASYATNAELLDGLNSSVFVSTGSFNSYTSSNDAAVTSVAALASLAAAGVSSLTSRTGSYTTTSSFNSYTSSNDTTVNSVAQSTVINAASIASLNSKTGSYSTTGSNTFVGGQYFSSSFNPTGFTTTASLYTDGGLRVTKDMYVSGTAYFNNVTVFGTQSIAYISSSQLNIGTNIINVNTDTPSVRFGGLAVYDSGSTGLTGSILWDSQNNHWVYSNPSGSTYSGGMFISGPRTSTLGSETGTSACMLLAGQGGDHLTSSMIYHSSTVTCIPTAIIGGSTACFANSVTSLASNISADGAGVVLQGYVDNTLRIAARGSGYNDGARGNLLAKEGSFDGKLTVSQASTDFVAEFTNTANSTPYGLRVKDAGTPANNYPLLSVTNNAGSTEYFRVNSGTGISTFSGTVCSPSLDIMPSGIGSSTLGGIMRVVTAGTSTGIAVGQSNANRYTHIAANDIQVFNDDFFLSTRCAFPLSIGTCYTARLTFAATGVACFACQICTTSAALSGNVIFNRASTSAGNNIEWRTANTLNWYIGTRGLVDNNFYFVNEGLSTNNLILNASTGAATFSDEVRAGSWIATANNRGFTIRNAANTAYRTAVQMNSSNVLIFGQDTDITALTLGVGSEAIRITSGGNVGINTTFSGINTASLLTIKAAGSDGNQIYIVQSNDDRGWRLKAKTDGHFYLQSSYQGSDTTNLMITYDTGRVGIGTTSPLATLDVNGASFLNNIFVETRNAAATSNDYPRIFTSDGNAGGIRPAEFGHIFIQSRSTAPRSIGFVTGTTPTERMTVAGDGAVGIGSNQPTSYGSGYANLWVGSSGKIGYLSVSNGSVNLELNADGNGVVRTRSNHPLILGTNETERMRITSDGAVRFGSNASTIINADGGNGYLYSYAAGDPKIYIEANGVVAFLNPNGVGVKNTTPNGLFEVGMTCARTTSGGFLVNTLSVADSNWFCFFCPPANWAGLMTMNWVAPNDHNRSGAAQVRWSYQNCSAALGPTTSIFNDSQNATATFRYAGGWLQACITGAGAGYSVQFTIMGARGA